MTITDRDLDIFEDHYRHALLSTDHLTAMHCHSEVHKHKIRGRVRKLRKAGFIKLLPSAINEPNVSVITQPAMNALATHRHFPPKRISIPRSTKQYRSHDLALADFTVTFDLFARSLEGVQMIDELSLVHRSPRFDVRSHRGWPVSFSHEGIRNDHWVKPDRFLGLKFESRPDNQNARYYAIELDHGSMPIKAASMEKASIQRKLLAYQSTYAQKLLQELFAIPYAYVLFVCPSDRRRNNMIAAAQELVTSDKAAQSMLFVTQPKKPSVGDFADLTTLDWIDGTGQSVDLPL